MKGTLRFTYPKVQKPKLYKDYLKEKGLELQYYMGGVFAKKVETKLVNK